MANPEIIGRDNGKNCKAVTSSRHATAYKPGSDRLELMLAKVLKKVPVGIEHGYSLLHANAHIMFADGLSKPCLGIVREISHYLPRCSGCAFRTFFLISFTAVLVAFFLSFLLSRST